MVVYIPMIAATTLLIWLPLYTNILTTTEYGTYDLFNTTVGVLLPILTLNVQDAVMRFAMDSKSNRKAIISVAMKILLVANTVPCGAIVKYFYIKQTAPKVARIKSRCFGGSFTLCG